VFNPGFRSADMRARMSGGRPDAVILTYVGRLGAGARGRPPRASAQPGCSVGSAGVATAGGALGPVARQGRHVLVCWRRKDASRGGARRGREVHTQAAPGALTSALAHSAPPAASARRLLPANRRHARSRAACSCTCQAARQGADARGAARARREEPGGAARRAAVARGHAGLPLLRRRRPRAQGPRAPLRGPAGVLHGAPPSQMSPPARPPAASLNGALAPVARRPQVRARQGPGAVHAHARAQRRGGCARGRPAPLQVLP